MARRADQLEFFPFFVDAFLDATRTWPAQRVGAYVRLLSHQWKSGSVPGDDPEDLGAIMAVMGESMDVAQMWERLKVKFPKGDKGYQNRKLEEVRADVLRRVKVNKNRTKAATEAKQHRNVTRDDYRDDARDDTRPDSRDDNRHGERDKHVTSSVTDDKLRNSEILNSKIPPLPAHRAGVVELSAESRLAIEGVLQRLTVTECATPERFADALIRAFRALGWSVEPRMTVPNRGDGRGGFIDIVVHAPARIAIELDSNLPRQKSIEKLLTFADSDGYAPVVLCRQAPAPGWWTERRGVEVWGLGEEPEPQFSSHRRAH